MTGTDTDHAAQGPARSAQTTSAGFWDWKGIAGVITALTALVVGVTGLVVAFGGDPTIEPTTNTVELVGEFTGCDEIQGIPEGECAALVDLFDQLHGSQWRVEAQRNWTETDAPCFEGEGDDGVDTGWYGVQCTSGRVTGLFLADIGLSGWIPSSITNFDALEVCFLHGNPDLMPNPGPDVQAFVSDNCTYP